MVVVGEEKEEELVIKDRMVNAYIQQVRLDVEEHQDALVGTVRLLHLMVVNVIVEPYVQVQVDGELVIHRAVEF